LTSRFDRFVTDEPPQRGEVRSPTSRFDRYMEEQQGPGEISPFTAALSGAADSASFGFGDELVGLAFGERAMEASRQRQDAARAQQGGWYLAGQVGGGLVGGGAVGLGLRGAVGATRLANAARTIGPMGRIGAAAAFGGVGGATYGAGSAYDNERLQGAANGFLPGAIGGGAFQGAGEVGGRVFGAVQRSLSPEARSGRMMAEALERFGPQSATPQQVEQQALAALQNAPANAMVADVVPGFTSLVRGAGVRPSAAREELRQVFDARNNAMGGEAIDDIWTTLAPNSPRSASEALESLTQQQRRDSKPLYDAVMSRPVDPRRAESMLGEITRRNPRLFEAAKRDADDLMLSEHGTTFNKSDPRYWHYQQIGADQVFERMRAAQGGLSGNERRVFGRALDAYRIQLRRLLGPEFGRAQDIWSGASRQRRAVEMGFAAIKPGANDLELGEITQALRRMTAGERQQARVGAVARLQDMIENADTGSGRADVLRSVLRSQGQRRVLQTLFGGEAGFSSLIRRLDRQRDLFRASVDTGIGVNSHTAPLQAAYESQQALTRPTGIRDGIFRLLTRDASDRFDEGVSNDILRTAGMNANQVAGEVAQVGGFQNWAGGRGLLSRAIRERQRMLQQRPEALLGAVRNGLYYAPVGGAAASYGMGG
jgi:hypothetical protein